MQTGSRPNALLAAWLSDNRWVSTLDEPVKLDATVSNAILWLACRKNMSKERDFLRMGLPAIQRYIIETAGKGGNGAPLHHR